MECEGDETQYKLHLDGLIRVLQLVWWVGGKLELLALPPVAVGAPQPQPHHRHRERDEGAWPGLHRHRGRNAFNIVVDPVVRRRCCPKSE